MSYIFVNGSRIKDLTNMTFGYLTAKECIGIENRYAIWLCECCCGCEGTTTATSKQLLGKRKTDCGSGKSKKSKRRDLTGQVFDHLKVIKLLKDGKRQRYLTECLLCGNLREMLESNLVSRTKKSCDCMRGKNIEGTKFGELTTVRKTDKRDNNGSIIWEFLCTCGNTCYYSIVQVNSGIRSCGCYNEIMKEKNTHLHIVREPGKLRTNNKSGVTGVMKTQDGKWQASITFQKINYYLGRYTEKNDAISIRKIAENKLYDDFLEWYNNVYKKTKDN